MPVKKRSDPDVPHGFVVDLAIWKCVVVITWERNPDRLIKYGQHFGIKMSNRWLEEWLAARQGADGTCSRFGDVNADQLIWLKYRPRSAKQFSTLYHELYHATQRVAQDHGFHDEPEAGAYTFERLITECNRRLWPKK